MRAALIETPIGTASMNSTANPSAPFTVATIRSTTTGNVVWDDDAHHVLSADFPVPPDDDPAWEMEGVVLSELRLARQTIVWFWKKTSLILVKREDEIR